MPTFDRNPQSSARHAHGEASSGRSVPPAHRAVSKPGRSYAPFALERALAGEGWDERAVPAKPAGGATLPVQAAAEPGGAALSGDVRGRMEPRFGWNFARVRVHAGARDGEVALRAGAAAFTAGNDIYFAPGRYRPGTRDGDALLAHELAHVVQQRWGSAGASVEAAEQDADRAERSFAAGQPSIHVREAAPGGVFLAKPLTPGDVEVQASSKTAGTPMIGTLAPSDMAKIYPMLGKQPQSVIDQYTALTNRTFQIFQMDTVESRAFFLAQAFIESGQFSHMVEADLDPANAYTSTADRNPLYTPAQLAEYKGRYSKKTDINPLQNRLPAGWSGPKSNENFAYVGRGPVQVTTSTGYKQAEDTLEHWAAEYEKNGDPPGIKATDLPGTGATVHERLRSAAKALRDNPALAADPDYAFLLSGAFVKTGWYGSKDTSVDAISLDVLGTRTKGDMSASAMYGKSGRMHGHAKTPWPTDAASEAKFNSDWGGDATNIKANFTDKASAYNRIRDILMSVSAANASRPSAPAMTGQPSASAAAVKSPRIDDVSAAVDKCTQRMTWQTDELRDAFHKTMALDETDRGFLRDQTASEAFWSNAKAKLPEFAYPGFEDFVKYKYGTPRSVPQKP